MYACPRPFSSGRRVYLGSTPGRTTNRAWVHMADISSFLLTDTSTRAVRRAGQAVSLRIPGKTGYTRSAISTGQSARLITEAILVRLQGGPPDKEVTAVAFDYKASAWLRLSKSIMRRDGYRCQLSKRYGKNVPAELVHHIYPVDEYPEYAMCRWNLIALSRAEHNTLHDRNTGALTAKGIALQRRTRIP